MSGPTSADPQAYRPPHPFPARMAAEVALATIKTGRRPMTILDPMVGSGTTAAVAKSKGHFAIGFDSDPLAVILANAWCNPAEPEVLRKAAVRTLEEARRIEMELRSASAYPEGSDEETKEFLDYWFDEENRRQLAALAKATKSVRQTQVRNSLWCAFSRLIITKQSGVSRAMDLAHSRPHRVRQCGTIKAFDHYLAQVERVAQSTAVSGGRRVGRADIRRGDARRLSLQDSTVDLVVTSPPYLNAIDYLRAHKFTLIWIGYQVGQLRRLGRSTVGTERAGSRLRLSHGEKMALEALGDIDLLPQKYQRVAERYIRDLRRMLHEVGRVLRPGGEAVFVIGNSTVRGVYLRNSAALTTLAGHVGLEFVRSNTRRLRPNRRYLPPPQGESGNELANRMRSEVILRFARQV